MTDEELRALAAEYNSLQKDGAAMWEKLEPMAERMKKIRQTIDAERPNCYDEIVLLFGGALELEL
jgi:predicted  nucleic acid-binding Zn-ribbon protein